MSDTLPALRVFAFDRFWAGQVGSAPEFNFMFAHIRRHQKWLMFIFAAVVIVSMVQFLDPTVGRRGGGRNRSGGDGSGQYGSINGRELTREEVYQAAREARLRFFLSYGRWPESDETFRQFYDEDRELGQRLFLIEKIKDLDVRVSDAAVADWIAHNFRDREGGQFRLERYQQIVQQLLRPAGYSEEEFREYARHEVGIQHLVALGGVSGSLIPPREAEALFRKENEEMKAEVVLFSVSNYLAGVEIKDAALQEFYTNNMARYRTPEQVQVSYVKFEATNYLAEVNQQLAQRTNLTAELQAEYQRRGADSFKDKDGKTLSPEAAIEKMKEEGRQSLALLEARKKATPFAEQLFELYEKEKQADNLERLAAATGLQSAVTEPFSRSEGPKDLKASGMITQVAFALTPEQPIASEPLVGEEAVFVIALKRKLPSEVQPFDSVREKVTEEYRRREAMQAAQKAGQAFYAALTNGLAQNRTFEAICAEAKVEPAKLPPFSASTRSLPDWDGRLDLNLVRDIASALAPGKTSEFVPMPTRGGGLVLRLISKQPVDEAKVRTELPAFVATLRETRQREAFSEWFRKELELAHVIGLPSSKKSKGSTTK
jgi:hypothetical protein